MGKRWRATLMAEDGSVLKVIGDRQPHRDKRKGDSEADRKVRLATTARRERDEDRTWKRDARNLRGQLVIAVEQD